LRPRPKVSCGTPAEPVLAPSGRVDQRFDIGGTVYTYKEEEEEEDNFGQSLREGKNETQCLEREAATRDERALTRTSPRREKNAFSSLKRGTSNI
tara:strand:- start:89 stop:373 length:285 start_codon:yes stop_codon:yes gene_type:complete